MKSIEQLLLWAVLGAALLVRLAHLAGPLDEPSWRQTDTTYMALRMFRESPPDLLRPKAPYRGSNDVKAAEFPLYPLAAALAYKAVGHESLPLGRAVNLFFFAVGAWALYGSLRLLLDRRAALYAAAIYAVLPLGIAYSRMIHPDFTIVCCAHVMWWGWLQFFHTRRWSWYALGVVAGALAFLMKAPYAFYFGLPVATWVLARREGWTVRNLAALALFFVLPLFAAVWFNEHRIVLERPFQESLLYPMKWTHESSAGRFFGTLAQRLDGESWALILRRFVILVATPAGVLLALLGACSRPRDGRCRGWWALQALSVGAVLYILVVFPMVASPHEYYCIPLLAPVAALAGWGLARIVERVASPAMRAVAIGGAFLALSAGSVYGLHRGPYLYGDPYFSHDWQRLAAGAAIARHTRPEDLVVSVTLGRSTGWSDPRILYVADRCGWAIEHAGLTPAVLEDYRRAGARWVALLVTPERQAEAPGDVLGNLPLQSEELRDPQGRVIGWMQFMPLAGSERP